MEIKDTKSSLDALKDRMDKSDKVFYVRFGDNDISNIIGKDYRGRDLKTRVSLGNNKTVYSLEQSKDIEKSFLIEHPDYMRGLVGAYPIEEKMRAHVFKYSNKSLNFLSESVQKLTNSLTFFNPIVFHYYFYAHPEAFLSFVEDYINSHKILFAGSCNHPDRLFNVHDRIKTTDKNSYSQKKEVMREFNKKVKNHSLVIMATGQLTRAMAHHAWRMSERFHYIDIGSLVDVLDSKSSRGWIRKTDVLQWWQKKLGYV